jgi:hypothetical protein
LLQELPDSVRNGLVYGAVADKYGCIIHSGWVLPDFGDGATKIVADGKKNVNCLKAEM